MLTSIDFATSWSDATLLMLDALAKRYGHPPSYFARMSAEEIAINYRALQVGRAEQAKRQALPVDIG